MKAGPGVADALIDTADGVVVSGAAPGQTVRVDAELDLGGQSWSCSGEYVASINGVVDTSRDPSIGGSYRGVDAFGLFWSADLGGRHDWRMLAPMGVTCGLPATARSPMRPTGDGCWPRGVTEQVVEEDAVKGRLFLPAGPGPGVVLLAGSDGGPASPVTAALLAGHGVAALSLAHWNHPGTPQAMREIDVEVVGRACDWLRSRGEVDDRPPAVVGISRGGELALLAASFMPWVVGPVVSLAGGRGDLGRARARGRRERPRLALRG